MYEIHVSLGSRCEDTLRGNIMLEQIKEFGSGPCLNPIKSFPAHSVSVVMLVFHPSRMQMAVRILSETSRGVTDDCFCLPLKW